jgi:hypothetical protein
MNFAMKDHILHFQAHSAGASEGLIALSEATSADYRTVTAGTI